MLRVLVFLVSVGARAIRAVCRRRGDLVLENLALRQQVTTQKKERRRLPLEDVDRAFWVALRQSWLTWASRLFIVKADTVARWHRDRFRRYWAKISPRRHPGRPRVDAEVRQLIRTMAQDGWGAPRIHAELTKLGFIISEKTVSRYLPRRPPQPDELKRWMAFLRNHKEDIAAMDLFTVPTASLRLLYGFFIIEHDRRHIVHFNATFHPTAAWVLQQLRDAFPYESAPQYLIFDRDYFQRGGRQLHQGHGHDPRPYVGSEPLAERNRRALDRQLSERAAQASRGLRREASRSPRTFVDLLLP